MIAWGVISFIVALNIHLFADFRRWKKGKAIDHSKHWRTFLWCALLIPSIYFFIAAHPGNVYWVAVNVLLMEFFVYSLLFDGLYNELRNFNWWFTGSNDGNQDAVTDNFWRSIGKTATQIIKITGTIVSIAVYVVTFLRGG